MTLASRNARHHMGIAMSLITVIPGLALCYLLLASDRRGEAVVVDRPLVLMALVTSIALGYVILSRYPINIVRLRNYLQDMVNGELPDKVKLLHGMDDISAIERSLNLIVGQLSNQVQKMQKELTQVEWLLSRSVKPAQWQEQQVYGGAKPGEPESRGLILTSVGEEVLSDIAGDFLDLVETFAVVYEQDLKVALRLVVSDWCRFLDRGFRAGGGEDGTRAPGHLCEEVWRRTAQAAILKGEPTDAECPDGTRAFFAPVWACDRIIGAIGFGYGDPTRDPAVLDAVASLRGVNAEVLRKETDAYETRPPFIVGLAKNRLITSARLIGEMTERKQAEDELRKHRDHLEELIEERAAELKRANAQLKREVRERRAAERLKDDFVSTVSHELRTPLAIMKEGISLLLDRIPGEINEKQERVLTTASGSVNRLARIINDLLDISKIEAGKMEIRKERVNLSDIVRTVVAPMKSLAEQKGLRLEMNLAAENLEVYADAERIVQVITNLIGNAVKFTTEGSIRVSTMAKDGDVGCSVEDSGEGIPKEDLPKLFQKFVQIRRTYGAGEKGTGLGLAIAKNIVELHNGRIWVESEQGKGTTFNVTFPRFSEEGCVLEKIEGLVAQARQSEDSFTLFVIRLAEGVDADPDECGLAFQKGLLNLVESKQLGRASDFATALGPREIVLIAKLGSADPGRLCRRWEAQILQCFRDEEDKAEVKVLLGYARYPKDGHGADELLAKARGGLGELPEA